MDSDRHAAEIYAVDNSGGRPVSLVSDIVAAQARSLIGICFDTDASTTHPALRSELGTAMVQLRSGVATALVLDEDTYEAMPNCLWLKVALQNSGSVLRLAHVGVGAETIVALEAPDRNINAIAVFRVAGFPLGVCREDVG